MYWQAIQRLVGIAMGVVGVVCVAAYPHATIADIPGWAFGLIFFVFGAAGALGYPSSDDGGWWSDCLPEFDDD